MYLFIAPLELDKINLERIESSIISDLKSGDGIANDFIDNYRPSRIIVDSDKVEIKMKFPDKILGANLLIHA